MERLAELQEGSVQCVVTSPPYWALRDYGVEGQIGLEPTVGEYVQKMVEVFRSVRRVLRKDGTCWVNLGDSYIGSRCGGDTGASTLNGSVRDASKTAAAVRRSFRRDREPTGDVRHKRDPGLKSKDIAGIPWRVAFALQEDGWWLRQDIIWHKPSPMPEAVRDRCTKAHEYLFLLTRSPRYYFDHAAIQEPSSPDSHARSARSRKTGFAPPGQSPHKGTLAPRPGVNPKARIPSGWDTSPGGDHHGKVGRYPKSRQNESFSAAVVDLVETRNKRSVWTIPAAPFSGAHFATFPPDLVKPCVMAGSRPGDVVLDPFAGSGTTGMVALELGRSAVLIELNPCYVQMIEERCRVTVGLGL